LRSKPLRPWLIGLSATLTAAVGAFALVQWALDARFGSSPAAAPKPASASAPAVAVPESQTSEEPDSASNLTNAPRPVLVGRSEVGADETDGYNQYAYRGFEIALPDKTTFGVTAAYRGQFSGDDFGGLLSAVADAFFWEDFQLPLPHPNSSAKLALLVGSHGNGDCAPSLVVYYALRTGEVVASTFADEALARDLLQGHTCKFPEYPTGNYCGERNKCLTQHLGAATQGKTFDGPILRVFSQLHFK
jgi:hypothetical protein